MKNLSFALVFFGICLQAQTYKITYTSSFEGKERPNQDKTVIFVDKSENVISSEKILNHQKKRPYEITKTNTKNFSVNYFGFLKDGLVVSTTNDTIVNSNRFSPKPETKKILGYLCKKAVTSVNSNTMEVWYTTDLSLFGGPSTLGQNLGLVLEVVRNGNSSIKATQIEKLKKGNPQDFINAKNPETTDGLSYKDLIWKSRFTTIPVFKDEIINFTDQPKSDENIQRFANGTIILKKVKFPEIKDDELLFVELKQQSNGDAYDRTGTVFAIPQTGTTTFYDALTKNVKELPAFSNGNGKEYYGVVSTENYAAPIELMRFFTPFGINHFNYLKLKDKNWLTQTPYRQDITDMKRTLSGQEIWIGAFIGNYDKGGHKISLEFTIHKGGDKTFNTNFNLPLFNTLNIMEMAGQDYATMFNSEKGLEVSFELKTNLKNAYLKYTTTGHGGWGSGDEFVPRKNTILLDGKEVYAFIPWRTDCGSYRLYNPASGNFENGISSSDLSRSNWCPGTTTNPVFIPLGDLSAGKHNIRVKIPQGENEGSSFNSWNVSGFLEGTTN